MTNLKSISEKLITAVVKTSIDKHVFFGFSEFERSDKFWKDLNRIFKARPDTSLYLYTYKKENSKLAFLSLLPDLQKLKVCSIDALGPIQNLHKLKDLSILDTQRSVDFDFSNTPEIEDLWINSKCKVSTLKSMQFLKKLKGIEITANSNFKLENLTNCKKIEILNILTKCNFDTRIFADFFSDKKKLRKVIFTNLGNLKLEEIMKLFSRLPHLEELRLASKEVIKIGKLQAIPKLKELALNFNGIDNFEWIKPFEDLQELIIGNYDELGLKDFELLIENTNNLKELKLFQSTKTKALKKDLITLFSKSSIKLEIL